MNDLEKKASAEELNESPASVNAANPENDKEATASVTVEETTCDDACAVTESPAEAIAEVAGEADPCDNADTEACVETESPAEAISEATDAIAEEKTEEAENEAADNGAELKVYFSMSKEELVKALEALVEADASAASKEITAIKQAFFIRHNRENDAALEKFVEEGGNPADFTAPADEYEGRLKELLTQYKEKRAAYLEAEEARKKENLAKKQEILDKIRNLSEDIDNINLKFPEFQQLQADFKAIKDIPQTDETSIWKNFQLAVEQFYDRLKMNKELRDLDFKKNLEAKETLIAEAEKLTEAEDVIDAFRRVGDLHAIWRELGPVAKDLRDDVWNRFKAASTIVYKRHQDFFEARKAVEAEAEEKKRALLDELKKAVEEMPENFNKWDAVTKLVMDIQGRWKEAGMAARKINNELYNEYRALCDKFFEAKKEFFNHMRSEHNENMAKKVALCEKAEAVKADLEANPDSFNMNEGYKVISGLQEEWRKVGSVARKQSDAIWERFQNACNAFYNARKKRNEAFRKDEHANLDAKRAVIAQIREIPSDIDRNEGLDRLKELQTEWQKIGHVPFKDKDQLFSEYREACDALYETLRVKRNNARMSSYQKHVGNLENGGSGLNREKERLLRQLDAKKIELKTMENNLGFFNVKSSAGNTMLKEMERRMNALRDEMKLLEQKIALVNEKQQ